MRIRRLVTLPVRASVAAWAFALTGAAVPAAASSAGAEQVAWVRRAAHNFVTAELAGDGASACATLNAPLRASAHHRTCAQRWDAKLASLLHERGERGRLRAESRAIATARVLVRGYVATIALPEPLMHGPNRFLWSENCWMLEG